MLRKGFVLENCLYQAVRLKHPDYDVLDIMEETFLEKFLRLLKRPS